MKKKDEIIKTTKIIYAGYVLDSKDTLVLRFKEGKKYILFRKFGYHFIGRTYVLNQIKNERFLLPKHGFEEAKKQKPIDDKQIEEWGKESEINQSEKKAIIERRKIDNNSTWLKALEPIRLEWKAAGPARQLAIELCVLREIRRFKM